MHGESVFTYLQNDEQAGGMWRLVSSRLRHLKGSGADSEAIALGAKVFAVASLAVDVSFPLTQDGGLQSLVALCAVEARNMPCGTASHLLFGHVHGLAAAWADVRASPARLLLGHRLHRAVLGCHVRLRRCRDVAGGRPILVPVARIHGEYASPSAVAVALGAEQFSIARAAEDVSVVLRQVAAVQTTVAVRICT